eukprot:gnl/TRDRNA2_/TRDRNA2_175422_c3_seq2.p1 gnl/TRDRNA2_/TRDRNA2_175422_c3~~gnl/TRDRNA2_/TRDRNA2_175422_c3_seq2.p1  ORF type:complete len:728 (-),score=169.54 gnl/TRDRNA2_/TRDRNA2_175422_c3_seq2:173-2095(-)
MRSADDEVISPRWAAQHAKNLSARAAKKMLSEERRKRKLERSGMNVYEYKPPAGWKTTLNRKKPADAVQTEIITELKRKTIWNKPGSAGEDLPGSNPGSKSNSRQPSKESANLARRPSVASVASAASDGPSRRKSLASLDSAASKAKSTENLRKGSKSSVASKGSKKSGGSKDEGSHSKSKKSASGPRLAAVAEDVEAEAHADVTVQEEPTHEASPPSEDGSAAGSEASSKAGSKASSKSKGSKRTSTKGSEESKRRPTKDSRQSSKSRNSLASSKSRNSLASRESEEGSEASASGSEYDSGEDETSVTGTLIESAAWSMDWDPEDLLQDKENRQLWWEKVKELYCDSYFLMFEEGAVYFQEEQEIALVRAQLLMFFFALQCLCDVAWEGHNALERVLQAVAPPFARLPLRPPHGMEAAGGIIRGLCQRARIMGEPTRSANEDQLSIEAGEYQEKMREEFEHQFFACKELSQILDGDKDGEVTMEEFVAGIMTLPASGTLRFAGVPTEVVDLVVHDLAVDLFNLMDDDGNGTLTNDEIRVVLEERKRAADAYLAEKENYAHKKLSRKIYWEITQFIPGTEAYKDVKARRKERIEKAREKYSKFLAERKEIQRKVDESNAAKSSWQKEHEMQKEDKNFSWV